MQKIHNTNLFIGGMKEMGKGGRGCLQGVKVTTPLK
jgi:hypothetical protein